MKVDNKNEAYVDFYNSIIKVMDEIKGAMQSRSNSSDYDDYMISEGIEIAYDMLYDSVSEYDFKIS